MIDDLAREGLIDLGKVAAILGLAVGVVFAIAPEPEAPQVAECSHAAIFPIEPVEKAFPAWEWPLAESEESEPVDMKTARQALAEVEPAPRHRRWRR